MSRVLHGSAFKWLDYSDHDRRKVLDVVDLFAEKTTQDDLGIGTVRDAFSEMLFPGTSTVQTRAKYLLFIPWIYRRLEDKRVPSARIADRARSDEIALIESLAGSEDLSGVIGITARRKLRRLPSETYWSALGRYGIRTFHGSQDDYHRSLDCFYAALRDTRQRERREGEAAEASPGNWHHALPPAPSDFPRVANFALTRPEAEFLAERIRLTTTRPGRPSLIAFLVARGEEADVDFAWAHPQLGEFADPLPAILREARMFSELMYGAQMIYNHMLVAKSRKREWEELGASYSAGFEEWIESFQPRKKEFGEWDRKTFWSIVESDGARITPSTRRFVEGWWDLAAQAENVTTLIDDPGVHNLITSRESQMKGPLARLQNPRALEMWGGAASAFQQDYRWGNAKMIVADILRGVA